LTVKKPPRTAISKEVPPTFFQSHHVSNDSVTLHHRKHSLCWRTEKLELPALPGPCQGNVGKCAFLGAKVCLQVPASPCSEQPCSSLLQSPAHPLLGVGTTPWSFTIPDNLPYGARPSSQLQQRCPLARHVSCSPHEPQHTSCRADPAEQHRLALSHTTKAPPLTASPRRGQCSALTQCRSPYRRIRPEPQQPRESGMGRAEEERWDLA